MAAAYGPQGLRPMSALLAAGGSANVAYGLGIAGGATALLVYVTLIPIFVTIYRTGAVGQNSFLPYTTGFLNSLVWAAYSLPVVQPAASLIMLSVNLICAACMLSFCVVIIVYTPGNGRKLKMGLVLAAEVGVVVCLTVLLVTLLPVHSRRLGLGICGDLSGAAMYLVTLADCMATLASGNVDDTAYISTSLASFLNSSVWIVYACIHVFNPLVLALNVTGVLTVVLQAGFYILYKYYQN